MLILKEANDIANKLIHKNPITPRSIPAVPGVYLIRDKDGIVIYVGKSRDLNRRINSAHISGELNGKKSAFRRQLHEKRKMKYGTGMRQWIINNCEFAYEEISNSDMRHLVEALLITELRPLNDLLNANE
jgi:hypothetical protein